MDFLIDERLFNSIKPFYVGALAIATVFGMLTVTQAFLTFSKRCLTIKIPKWEAIKEESKAKNQQEYSTKATHALSTLFFKL